MRVSQIDIFHSKDISVLTALLHLDNFLDSFFLYIFFYYNTFFFSFEQKFLHGYNFQVYSSFYIGCIF